MKHYVYALCKKMEMIVAALSCPDEKTAKLAYVAACQDVGRDLEDSLCGIVRVEEDAMIKIHGNDGRDIKLRFGIGDFELAEKQTKIRILMREKDILSEVARRAQDGYDVSPPPKESFTGAKLLAPKSTIFHHGGK